MKKRAKLKYKINIWECDFYGNKPFEYKVFWIRKDAAMFIFSGYLLSVSRERALWEINKLIDNHRRAWDGKAGFYARCFAGN